MLKPVFSRAPYALSLVLLSACGGGGGGGSSPAVTVTPSPSPPPPAPLTVSKAAVSFGSTSDPAQSFTASETGFSGALTESDTCAAGSVATTTPNAGTGPSASFTVTPKSVGSCTITLTDTLGQRATVSVSVTATVIPVH